MNVKILAKINQRQRQLLVNAFLYYQQNYNIISDDKYDKFSFELDYLIKTYPEEFKASAYYKDFTDFIPDSGYYLKTLNKPEIIKVAKHLRKLEEHDRNKK